MDGAAVPSRVLPTFRGRPLGELQSECVGVSGGSVGPRGLERREDGRFAIWSVIEISRHRSSRPPSAAVRGSVCDLVQAFSLLQVGPLQPSLLVDILSIDPRRNSRHLKLSRLLSPFVPSHATLKYMPPLSQEGWLSWRVG